MTGQPDVEASVRAEGDTPTGSGPGLVEHFFRHEYGKLVAVLCRRVGAQHLEAVEDAAQSALMRGLEHWRGGTIPQHPSAWLYRVAHNALLDELRKRGGHARILEAAADTVPVSSVTPEPLLAGEVEDDLLRMLFACCDPQLPIESQLALALKTLCGFSVREIGLRLFASDAHIYKRISRARHRLREHPDALEVPTGDRLTPRLDAVRTVLYQLFTEGYLSSHATLAIRTELCDEALRLGHLLAAHSLGDTPETRALVALMHLHRARLDARVDALGTLLTLEAQDRTRWDPQEIAQGLSWLTRSAQGDVFSRFHAEAAIAAEHCLAPSMAETRWDRIADTYAMLESIAPSPLHRLNRAVALAEWKGPRAGLQVLEGFVPPAWLRGSYMWSAVLADLHRRAGDVAQAERHLERALGGAPSPAIADLLRRRWDGAE